jgi:hypothetical protein
MVWTCSENGRGKIAERSDEMVSTRKKIVKWVQEDVETLYSLLNK